MQDDYGGMAGFDWKTARYEAAEQEVKRLQSELLSLSAMLAAAPRPAPAEPQPIAAWSIVRTAESAVVTAVRAALSAAPAPQPAGGEPQPAAQQEHKPLTEGRNERAIFQAGRDSYETSCQPMNTDDEAWEAYKRAHGITATKGER